MSNRKEGKIHSKAQLRREQQRAMARADILVAASEAIAENGYRATSMSDIAARAGYSAGSLYTYFPSKEAIFKGLTRQIGSEVVEALDVPTPKGDLEDRMVARLAPLMAYLESHWTLLRAIDESKFGVDMKGTRDETDDVYWFFRERIQQWLAEEETHLQHGSPAMLSAALMGLIEGLLQYSYREDEPPNFQERPRELVRIFLFGASGTAPV